VVALVREDLAEHGYAGRSLDVTTYYVAGALVELLTWWVDTRNALGADQIEDLFRKLTTPVLSVARGIKV
jgi:hypothetical protein